MATTSTIGTSSRNYATISLWHAAFANGGWIGECYNDSEFNETPSIGGTSAVNYEILRPATGQSAFDTANPLKYDVTKGVGLKTTSAYSTLLTVGSYCTVQRMQFSQQGTGNNDTGIKYTTNAVNVVVDRCLVHNTNASGTGFGIYMAGGNNTRSLTNSVVICYKNNGIRADYDNAVIANVTIVAPSDQSNAKNALLINGSPKITNVAGFGFAAFASVVGGTPTGTNNATDAAAIGFTSSGSLTSKTYTNQFTGVTTAAQDFRIKVAADLIDAGATDTTDIPSAIDIFATSRPSGSAWDIGAYEYAAAGGSYTLVAAAGAYSISGAATKLVAARKMPANPGSYLVSGVATRTAAARKLSLASGSYAISGAATLNKLTRVLSANAGSYAINGAAAGAAAARKLAANPGVYSISGAATKAGRQITLGANAGSYIVTGNASVLTLTHRYILQAAPGSYLIAGSGAILSSSGSGPTATSDIYPWLRRQLRR